MPGEFLASEIAEQPAVLAGLLAAARAQAEEIAARLRARRDEIAFVLLAARGTSDNAARYAQYLFGAANQRPVALATPSLFTLYNALAASRGQLIVAAGAAPARLALRDDLRTRLAHGLVYEIVPLADTDKAQALGTYARERGFQLPTEAIDYLLAHGRRDMATLVATLAALDRHSLATKRPITVALLREWMRRQTQSDATPSDVIP